MGFLTLFSLPIITSVAVVAVVAPRSNLQVCFRENRSNKRWLDLLLIEPKLLLISLKIQHNYRGGMKN